MSFGSEMMSLSRVQNFKVAVSLNCHHDQILDTHFFTFSYTIGLSYSVDILGNFSVLGTLEVMLFGP